MSNKNIGTVLLVAGVIIVVVSLVYDMLGVGGDIHTFGVKQIVGVVVGIIAAVVGFVMRSRKA